MSGAGIDVGGNPQPVYNAGTSISDLTADADGATKKFLSALTDGAGAVHHSKLSSALSSYHTTWAKPANQLPKDVEAAGTNIASTGADLAQTDEQSRQDLVPSLGTSTGASPLLQRPISGPTIN